MLGCAKEHGQVLKQPEAEVYLEDFAENGLNMTMIFWVELDANTNGRRIDSDLRFMVEKRLVAAGIGIAFPMRALHVKSALPAATHDER